MGFNSERGDAGRCEKRRDEKEDEGDREEVVGWRGWESSSSGGGVCGEEKGGG